MTLLFKLNDVIKAIKAAICGQEKKKKKKKEATIPLFLISLVPLSLKKIQALMALAAPVCSSANQ